MSRAEKLRIHDYLDHIVVAIDRINRYVGAINEDEFLEDERPRTR
jgi:uncharacterized protein with HEPN domain